MIIAAAPAVGVDGPVGSDRHMADMPQIVGKDRRTEAGGQRNAGVAARAGGGGGGRGRRSRRPAQGYRRQYDGDGHAREGRVAAGMGETRFHSNDT